jgi:hypothetical protein
LEPISRWRLLAASGGAILAGMFGSKAALALDPSPMPVPSPWSRRWDVLMTMPSGTPATGMMMMDGAVYPVGAVSPAGSVATGFREVGSASVMANITNATRGEGMYNVQITIDGQGDVLLAGGLEGRGDESLAIIGGTGRFKDARGEAYIMWYNRTAGAMRVSLNMTTI